MCAFAFCRQKTIVCYAIILIFVIPFYTTLQRDWELVLKSIDSYVFMIRNLQIHATKGQPIYPSSFIDVAYRLTLRTVKRIADPHFTNKIRKFRRR